MIRDIYGWQLSGFSNLLDLYLCLKHNRTVTDLLWLPGVHTGYPPTTLPTLIFLN